MRAPGTHHFWFVAYALAAVMAGTNIASPLYNVYAERFSLSPLVLTVVFSIYVAVIVPGLLLFGPLADSVGRRPVLSSAVLTGAAASMVLAATGGVWWLLVGRVLEGISFAAAIGTGAAALFESHPKQDHRLAATVTTGAFLGGATAGPFMTGVLSEYGPWPLQLTYIVHAALLALALVLLAVVPEPLPEAARRRWRPARPAVPDVARAAFGRASAAAAVAGTCGALYLALSASYASGLLHTRNLAVIGGIVALFLGAGALTQLAFRTAAPRTSATLGLIAVAGGVLIGALAAPLHAVSLLATGSVLAGGGQGLAFRGTLAIVFQLAPASARADVTSAFYAIVYAATGTTAVALGLVATAATLGAAIPEFSVGIAALALAMALAVSRSRLGPGGESRDEAALRPR